MISNSFLGGGSGIGRAVCEKFARLGSAVVASDVDIASVEQTCAHLRDITYGSEKHMAFQCDVSNK